MNRNRLSKGDDPSQMLNSVVKQLTETSGFRSPLQLSELVGLFGALDNLSADDRAIFARVFSPLNPVLHRLTTDLSKHTDLLSRDGSDVRVVLNAGRCLLERILQKNADSEDLQLRYEHCHLTRMVLQVGKPFSEIARTCNIDFNTTISGQVAAICDPHKIEAILVALLFGAFKHTPTGGKIFCSLSEHQQMVQLAVEDSGPEVPVFSRMSIFDRSRFIDRSPALGPKGAQICLSDARDYLRLHGGDLVVDVARKGNGPRFIAVFPLEGPRGVPIEATSHRVNGLATSAVRQALIELREEASLRPVNDVPEQQLGVKRQSVLIVENSRSIHRLIVDTVRDEFNTLSAFNGEEGLELAAKYHPDVILTEISMPKMTGAEFIGRIRTDPNLLDIRIVVLSALEDVRMRAKLLEQGAHDVISKPFSTVELLARVRQQTQTKNASDILRDTINEQHGELNELASAVLRKHQLITGLNEQLDIAREAAERSNRVKSNFLRIISHELRTPVTALLLHTRMLKHSTEPGSVQRNTVHRLARSTGRLQTLLDTLAYYSRIDMGHFQPALEDVALTPLVSGIIDEFRPSAERKGLHLNYVAQSEDARLYTDHRLLRLIFINLIEQALARTKHGTIMVTVSCEDGCKVCIADQGTQMNHENFARMLDPLEAADDVRWTAGEGSGVGLSVIHRFVVALGGSLRLDSANAEGNVIHVALSTGVEAHQTAQPLQRTSLEQSQSKEAKPCRPTIL